jgi:hypothetical protein
MRECRYYLSQEPNTSSPPTCELFNSDVESTSGVLAQLRMEGWILEGDQSRWLSPVRKVQLDWQLPSSE